MSGTTGCRIPAAPADEQMTLAEEEVAAFSLPFDQQLHLQPVQEHIDMPLVAESHPEFPTEGWPMFETRPT